MSKHISAFKPHSETIYFPLISRFSSSLFTLDLKRRLKNLRRSTETTLELVLRSLNFRKPLKILLHELSKAFLSKLLSNKKYFRFPVHCLFQFIRRRQIDLNEHETCIIDSENSALVEIDS